jgi:hypothetical protein
MVDDNGFFRIHRLRLLAVLKSSRFKVKSRTDMNSSGFKGGAKAHEQLPKERPMAILTTRTRLPPSRKSTTPKEAALAQVLSLPRQAGSGALLKELLLLLQQEQI